jgi:hypothetical protein
MDREVMDMLNEMNDDYFFSVAKSMVDYELHSPKGAKDLQLNTRHLAAEARWWTSDEHNNFEWRVLRSTGVASANVVAASQSMERNLCVTQPALAGLQHLWIHGKLPASYNKSTEREGAGEGGEGPSVTTYSSLLFTDVGTAAFRSSLPMSMEEYSQHTDRVCSQVHDAFTDYWVNAASEVVSLHLQGIFDEKRKENQAANSDDSEAEVEVEERPINYGEWFENVTTVDDDDGDEEESGPFDQRLEIEGLSGEMDRRLSTASGGRVKTPKFIESTANQDKERIVGMLDSVAVLMCRQLRSTTEQSISTMVDFFERFDQKHASGDSAFVLTLRLLEVPHGDIKTPEDALAQIRVEPSKEEVDQAFMASVDAVVKAASQFSRVDQQIVGLPSDKIKTDNIGPCSMHLKDVLIIEAKARILAASTKHFEPAAALIERFKVFAPLLSGEEDKKVSAVIDMRGDLSNTRAVAAVMRKEIDRLRALSDEILGAVPDFVHYPLFTVHCHVLKGVLVKKIDSLIR